MSDQPNTIQEPVESLIRRLTERQHMEFGLWCAERVRCLMHDERSTNALDVAARYLRGEASPKELSVARRRAEHACCDAEGDAVGSPSNRDRPQVAMTRNAMYAASGAIDLCRKGADLSSGKPFFASARPAWSSARAAAYARASDCVDDLFEAEHPPQQFFDEERAVQRAELERMLGRAAGAEEVKP